MTPLMAQYFELKKKHHDSLLFFQVGDFYELFFDDAKTAATILGIALTKRGKYENKDIPLCGVPIHVLDHYLHKLVKAGFKVALADQLEPSKPGVVVKRGVTRVLTPGTLTDSNLLSDFSASYLCALFPLEKSWGFVCGEILTAQLYATQLAVGSWQSLDTELSRFFPDEILLPHHDASEEIERYLCKQRYFLSSVTLDDDSMIHTRIWLQKQFAQKVCDALVEYKGIQSALSLLYVYLHKNQDDALSLFQHINFYKPDHFMMLDGQTQRNLELIYNRNDGSHKQTLFDVMRTTATSMGSRALKKWLVRPLLEKKIIEQRFDVVSFFVEHYSLMTQCHNCLYALGDFERIVGRIALQRGLFHDYCQLQNVLKILPRIRILFDDKPRPFLLDMYMQHVKDFSELYSFLSESLNDDPTKQWIIKKGFNEKLDKLRYLLHHSHQKIARLEEHERKSTGIASLKIRYNQVYGYYVEITKQNISLVPDRYQKRQTLSGRERFTFSELQELEHALLSAHKEIEQHEQELFFCVKQRVGEYVSVLRKCAHALSHLDLLCGFALVAHEQQYVRPEITETGNMYVKKGKHPVVARVLEGNYVANDIDISDKQSLLIITGPNMGGKSTYLRQAALLSIMAQCGSFVPAQSATLPIFDRIFTRIGASDNVAAGKSTFLVEMEETAHICAYATSKSLIILDEVGRGTSTFDGMALAQAIVEYLYKEIQARCLFATHYHELTALEHEFKGIASYYVSSMKTDVGLVFLHTLLPGVADESFGIDVARLALVPQSIIDRAQHVLCEIVQKKEKRPYTIKKTEISIEDLQKKLAHIQKKLAHFESIDYDNLSPKKAFDLLWQLKEQNMKNETT